MFYLFLVVLTCAARGSTVDQQPRGQDGQRQSESDRIPGLGRVRLRYIWTRCPVYQLRKSLLDADVPKFVQYLQEHRTVGSLYGQLHAP